MLRRTDLLKGALRGAFFIVFIVAAVVPRVAADDAEIVVFTARKIHTMDRGWPAATAVALRGGRILSVGSLADLQPWLERHPHRVDRTFEDKVLLPGFVEPHGHAVLGGGTFSLPLLSALPMPRADGSVFPGVRDREEALAKLRRYAEETDGVVMAYGYDVLAMGGEHLDKTILDRVSTTRPILVWDASQHFVYANSAALREYGVTASDTATTGIMAGEDGEPNGQFLGVLALHRILAEPMAGLLVPEVALRNMRALLELSRKNGITTTSELVSGAIHHPLELQLMDTYFNDPGSPLRCVVVTDATSMERTHGGGTASEKTISFVRELRRRNTDKLIFNGVKFFADDAFLSLSMVLDPPTTDGREGLFMIPPEKMAERFRPWWQAGFQIHVHANGNAGIAAVIDALARLQEERPRFDHRFTLTHYGMSTPEQAWRLKALGGQVSVNPYYVYYRGEIHAPYVGTDRAHTAARLRTIRDAGVPVSLHADTPVAPPYPLELVWIAVNRFGRSGKVLAPEERVTVEEALRMVTIEAAYTLGVEDRVGSIAPGKFADFVVLEADPLAVPVEELKDIAVWGTVVGGRVSASDLK